MGCNEINDNDWESLCRSLGVSVVAKKTSRKWRGLHSGSGPLRLAWARAFRLNIVPRWLSREDMKAIDDMFETAAHLTKSRGVTYSVEYIYEPNNKLYTGLFVLSNLCIRKGRNRENTDIVGFKVKKLNKESNGLQEKVPTGG